MTDPTPSRDAITGIILAGGRSLRMADVGGHKGLIELGGRPMLAIIMDRLTPQVGRTALNANDDTARFESLGLPVVADTHAGHPGPLAGLLAGMRWSLANTPHATHVATVPADTPFLPAGLVARLAAALGQNRIAVASSSSGTHPVIGLWPVSLAADLEAALHSGMRKVFQWLDRHPAAIVPFDDITLHGTRVDPFFNINTPADLARARSILNTPPVLGIAGWKNSGKTTLTAALVAELTARGIRVATLKHTHHEVTHIESPGADTARHRAAGSVATHLAGPDEDLTSALARLPPADLVLVEGYKRASIPKIEVRSSTAQDKTPLAPGDLTVIAICTDGPAAASTLPIFNRDDIRALADFIQSRFAPAPRSP